MFKVNDHLITTATAAIFNKKLSVCLLLWMDDVVFQSSSVSAVVVSIESTHYYYNYCC